MRSRWSDEEAAAVVARYGARWGEELALRTYTSRLLGAEDRLVLHGGGNTSAKGIFTNRLGAAGCRGMVWMRRGLMTWGPTARASYETMIEIVTRAETYLARKSGVRLPAAAPTSVGTALARVRQVAPVLRGCLAEPSGDPDR